jgi:DNA integrity scanning protein DisA with diadenylate cyclase activity
MKTKEKPMQNYFILWHGVNEWEEFNGTLEDAIKHIKSDARYKNYGHQGAMVIASSIHYEIAVDGTEYHKEAAKDLEDSKASANTDWMLEHAVAYVAIKAVLSGLEENKTLKNCLFQMQEAAKDLRNRLEAAESENEVLRKACNDRNHKGLDILIARHGLGQSLENTDDYGQDVALLAMLSSNRDDSSAP